MFKTFLKNLTIYKGSKGIRQWRTNKCTSPLIINKITPSVDYNKWLKRYVQFNKPTNQN